VGREPNNRKLNKKKRKFYVVRTERKIAAVLTGIAAILLSTKSYFNSHVLSYFDAVEPCNQCARLCCFQPILFEKNIFQNYLEKFGSLAFSIVIVSRGSNITSLLKRKGVYV